MLCVKIPSVIPSSPVKPEGALTRQVTVIGTSVCCPPPWKKRVWLGSSSLRHSIPPGAFGLPTRLPQKPGPSRDHRGAAPPAPTATRPHWWAFAPTAVRYPEESDQSQTHAPLGTRRLQGLFAMLSSTCQFEKIRRR